MWPPLRSRTPRWRLVCGAAVTGGAISCSATDLELVERVPSAANQANEDEPQDSTMDSPADSSSAALPPPVCGSGIIPLNRYRFRSQADSQCLSAGAATTVGGLDAYEVITEGDCTAAAATWQVLESTLGSFELRNVLVDYNLDVEYAEIEVGTPMVLFAAHGLENQKFMLIPLNDGSMAISPRTAQELCVQGDASGVFLNSCVIGRTTQKWLVETENCPLADDATE